MSGAAPAYIDVPGSRIAHRVVGSGQPLLMITGWPFNSYTYHKLIPILSPYFTCILVDSPGLGLTEWSDATDFTFPGQARSFKAFVDALGLDRYSLIAHNTGATIARLLAAEDTARLDKFVILNTEIPGERPPWFPIYARLMGLPGSGAIFRAMLAPRPILKSPMAFGGCYADLSNIDDGFIAAYVRPLLDDPRRLRGAMRYLNIGLDFRLIDSLPATHARITAPVHLIWGAKDPTFPVGPARRMMSQFPNCTGMTEIAEGKLLAHEEFPEQVGEAALRFLQ